MNRRFNKIVVIIPRFAHSIGGSKIIGVLIPSGEPEVNTSEQALLNTEHDVCCCKILILKKSGRKHQPTFRQGDSCAVERAVDGAQLKDPRVDLTPGPGTLT